MDFWSYGMPWMMVLGIVLMLLFWAGVIALVVWGIRAATRGSQDRAGWSAPAGGESAMDILKQRYARGEISREEYHNMRRDLEG